MADGVFNAAKGKIASYVQNVVDGSPANSALIGVILEVAEADDTLNNYDTLAAILAGANTEWTSPEYARITLTTPAVTVDDTANDVDLDVADFSLTAPTGNATVKLIVAYDPDTTAGTDANIVPLTHHDFALTPDGNDVNVQIPANGFAGIS